MATPAKTMTEQNARRYPSRRIRWASSSIRCTCAACCWTIDSTRSEVPGRALSYASSFAGVGSEAQVAAVCCRSALASVTVAPRFPADRWAELGHAPLDLGLDCPYVVVEVVPCDGGGL